MDKHKHCMNSEHADVHTAKVAYVAGYNYVSLFISGVSAILRYFLV
jgi:hypothetical protein